MIRCLISRHIDNVEAVPPESLSPSCSSQLTSKGAGNTGCWCWWREGIHVDSRSRFTLRRVSNWELGKTLAFAPRPSIESSTFSSEGFTLASSRRLESSLRRLGPPPSTLPQARAAFDTHPEQHVLFDAFIIVLDDVSTYYHLVSSSSKLDIFWSCPLIYRCPQEGVRSGPEIYLQRRWAPSGFPTPWSDPIMVGVITRFLAAMTCYDTSRSHQMRTEPDILQKISVISEEKFT